VDTVPSGLAEAGPADTIAGVPARFVASPSSTVECAAVVREAAARDLAVVVRGAGTKQAWALPPRQLDLILDTRRMTGVVEHAAGDLVVVVRAGTIMDDLAGTLAGARQQLALDVPLAGATVGGTVATATSGPRRMLYGAVRDLIIGVTIVRADGTVAHAGGKVVKNVAGYDLGKLMAGSYGTLAVLTECAFRLHPLPAAVAFVRCRVPGPPQAARLVAAVLGAQLVPSALEVDAPPSGGIDVTVLLEGVPAGVSGRVASCVALLGGEADVADAPPPGWGGYPWGAGDVGLRLSVPLSGVHAVLAAVETARERHGVALAARGSAGSGVLYAGLPGATDPDVAARVVTELRAAAEHAVVLTAPRPVRERVDVWGPVDALDLMRRVKAQFDPNARLAPGRFVGGI
jgi:glycolate oxidase FAD binding subunit